MQPRSRRWRLIALLGIVFFSAVGLGWLAAKHSVAKSQPVAEEDGSPAPESHGPENHGLENHRKIAAHLYFGDPGGRHLMAEQRVFDQPLDDAAFGRRLIESLIKGPRQHGSRTLPQQARVRAVYLLSAGAGDSSTAVVDFDSQAFATHPGGVRAELLAIYSIVNTLVFNVDNVRLVKILIGGHEAATLAGHADLSHSFAADMMWVR